MKVVFLRKCKYTVHVPKEPLDPRLLTIFAQGPTICLAPFCQVSCLVFARLGNAVDRNILNET